MFEELVQINRISQRHIFALILGFIYVVIGAVTAFILFYDFMSLAMLFLTSILLTPTLMYYLSKQEKIESAKGSKSFFKTHKDIIETYFFLFIGIFIGYLVIAMVAPQVLNYQFSFLDKSGVTPSVVQSVPASDLYSFFSILSRNLGVGIIAFLLSIFYGAGSIFLIVFNASIFASFIVMIINFIAKSMPHAASILGAFLIHLVPEIGGFLLAAMAGGVLSKALTAEKIGSDAFRNVVKDAALLLILSVILIVIGAFFEIYVTRGIFRIILG